MRQPRILLGFLTAYHPSRWHRRQILREQCLKNSPLPYKFVFGDEPYLGDRERCGLRDDEILHAPGSDLKTYLHLKNQELFKYALVNDFDYVMRCMDDTWAYPDRIMRAGLEPYDYAGYFPCRFNLGGTFHLPFARLNYAHGGCGIWLSRKAMEMLVTTRWDEHYLDSWPEAVDVGFGQKIARPPWYWDDHFIGEVLQGNLAYDDPLRNQPWEAYSRNGINLLEDMQLFWNDEPERPLTIHDPGVHKPNSREFDDIIEASRKGGWEMALARREAEEAARERAVQASPQEVPNAD